MKSTNKLEAINQKIAELTKQQKAMESKIIDSLSKRIAAILIKKRLTNIDVSEFLKKIENIIDGMNVK
jgi:flagellar biosynthesis chaperone FliJ